MSGRRKKLLDALRRAMTVGNLAPRRFRRWWHRKQTEQPLSARQAKIVDGSMARAKRFREQQKRAG